MPHCDSMVAHGLLRGALDGDGIWICHKSQPSLLRLRDTNN